MPVCIKTEKKLEKTLLGKNEKKWQKKRKKLKKKDLSKLVKLFFILLRG